MHHIYDQYESPSLKCRSPGPGFQENYFNSVLRQRGQWILSYNNHKELAVMYLLTAGIFSVVGTLISDVVRYELSASGSRLFAVDSLVTYNVLFTIHGLAMIFMFLMPALFSGFGNYFIPLYSGSAEVALPRINSISYFLLPLGSTLLLHSIVAEFGAAIGWTMYPPLSTTGGTTNTEAIDWVVLGLAILGLGSVLGSVNFLGTVLFGGSMASMRHTALLVWAVIFTAIMLIVTIPIFTGALVMLLADLEANYGFYDGALGGDAILYQHLFWFFGHPEVYILILPGFGVISQCVSSASGKPVFGGQAMILAMGCISILGTLVWVHHMMTTGLEADTRAYFSAVTIMIAIPTGTKIFNWICTVMASPRHWISADLWIAISFAVLFSLGGTTGVVMGNGGMDIALHDTYYIVAHFHFVLSLGAVLATICGLVFYYRDIAGDSYNQFTGYGTYMPLVGVWYGAFLAAAVLTFLPMHIMAFNVMPRRIPDYQDGLYYIHSLSSMASIAVLVLLLLPLN